MCIRDRFNVLCSILKRGSCDVTFLYKDLHICLLRRVELEEAAASCNLYKNAIMRNDVDWTRACASSVIYLSCRRRASSFSILCLNGSLMKRINASFNLHHNRSCQWTHHQTTGGQIILFRFVPPTFRKVMRNS